MDINITGRNVDLDIGLKAYVNKKFGKIGRIYRRIYKCDVILEEEKLRKIAEVILHLKRTRVVAKESSQDMYASIDVAADKIKKQLRRLNGKLAAKRRKLMFNRFVKPITRFGKIDEETDLEGEEI